MPSKFGSNQCPGLDQLCFDLQPDSFCYRLFDWKGTDGVEVSWFFSDVSLAHLRSTTFFVPSLIDVSLTCPLMLIIGASRHSSKFSGVDDYYHQRTLEVLWRMKHQASWSKSCWGCVSRGFRNHLSTDIYSKYMWIPWPGLSISSRIRYWSWVESKRAYTFLAKRPVYLVFSCAVRGLRGEFLQN